MNGPQVSRRSGAQWIGARIEARLVLHARRGAQAAVEVIRPGVVVALQRLAVAARLAHDLRATVAADVGEGAQLAVFAARDDDGNLANGRGDEIAWARKLVGHVHILPAFAEDSPLLQRVDRRIGVPLRRQRIAALQRLA